MEKKTKNEAQTLSSSVADAIEFCCEYLNLPQFQGCKATVAFLRMIDRLFDVLNSRNPFAKGYKSPLRRANQISWEPFLDNTKAYLLSLKNAGNEPMHTTKRKTPFVGLLCTINAVQGICSDYICRDGAPLRYLLTYKLSQDHIALFFGAVRASCGGNNNPTVRQFTAAYKRLLMRHNVQGGLGNITVQDETRLLSVTLDSTQDSRNSGIQRDTLDMAVARFYDVMYRPPLQSEHDYADVPNISAVSEYKQSAITYIAGYVVRMVKRKIHCAECQLALICNDCNALQGSIGGQFLKLKDMGGLIKASPCVVRVCEETEKCFQRMHAVMGDRLPHTSSLLPAITHTVLSVVGNKCFDSLSSHMFDSTVDNNHVFNLTKCIAHCYSTIRLHHLAKRTTFVISGANIRKDMSKLILFKHQ